MTPEHDDAEKLRARESTLVERAIEGDISAFIELVKPYEGRIREWCRKGGHLSNAEDVEDALQDTLLSTYRSLPNFDRTRVFERWLQKIAKYKGINTYRRLAKHGGTVSFESLMTDDTGTDRGWPDKRAEDPQDIAFQKEIEQIALTKLPDSQREALILQYRGLSIAAIAQSMGKSTSAVAQLLYRGRKRFDQTYRKLWEEQ